MRGGSVILNLIGVGLTVWVIHSLLAGDPETIIVASVFGLAVVGTASRRWMAISRAPLATIAVRSPGGADRASGDATSDLWMGTEWLPAGLVDLDATGKLVFPSVESAPGVYRFRIQSGQAPAEYVGETIDLRRRFAGYRSPGPTTLTNIRLNAVLRAALRCGGSVEVALLNRTVLDREGSPSLLHLEDAAVRRAVESRLVAAMRTSGGSVLNL